MTVHTGHFVDRAPTTLGKLERTPQGGYVAPGTFATVGIMPYSARSLRAQGAPLPAEVADADMVRIYLPPEAIESGLATMVGAPVTREHPARFVSPDTYSQVSCGTVLSAEFDGKSLKGKVAVQDATLIRDIELGARRGMSPGYLAVTDFTPGVTPEGQPYDARRVSLTYNHAAVVRDPRGGVATCLALDSDEIPATEEDTNVKIKIKGVEHDASAAQPVIDSLEASAEALSADLVKTKTELETVKAQLAVAVSPETIAKHVTDAKEAEVASQAKADKLAKVKAAYPTISLDGRSDTFIDGLFEAAQAQAVADPDGLAALRGTPAADPAVVTDSKPAGKSAKQRHEEWARSQWKAPASAE